MYCVSKATPNNEFTLLIKALPKILASDFFYEKFALRLMQSQSNDLSVEAARKALKGDSPMEINKLSRMTACVALIGCCKRSLTPIVNMHPYIIEKACKELVKDDLLMRDAMETISNKHANSIPSDPLFN